MQVGIDSLRRRYADPEQTTRDPGQWGDREHLVERGVDGESENVASGRPERLHRRRPAKGRNRSERQDGAADGKRGTTGERDDAVHLEEHARRRETVEAEEGGHYGERRADEHGVPVVEPSAGDGERDRGDGRKPGSGRNPDEVDPALDLHPSPPTKWSSATGSTAANAATLRNETDRVVITHVSAGGGRC